MDSRFLYHVMFSEGVYRQLQRLESGSNYPAVNEANVDTLNIPLPPVVEQRRIAEILDAIDAAIEQTEALIGKLKVLKVGLLHDLLTRGLDEQGRLRDAAAWPEDFRESEAGRIPQPWSVESVGELFDMQLGKMLSKAAKTGLMSYPYLSNRSVQWDRVDLSDLEWMDFTRDEREKFSLRPGDLLICEGGEVGRSALWRDETVDCYFQKAIHRLRPKDGRVLSDYALAYMRIAVDCGLLTRFVSQTSIAHLTREKLALLPVPLPSIAEQHRIIAALDAQSMRIQGEEDYRDKLHELKHGLMDDLLTGRVRASTGNDSGGSSIIGRYVLPSPTES